MSLSSQNKFLQKLEKEVVFQSQLDQRKLLPQKLGGLGRLVAHYPWQAILVVSGITAIVVVWFF